MYEIVKYITISFTLESSIGLGVSSLNLKKNSNRNLNIKIILRTKKYKLICDIMLFNFF